MYNNKNGIELILFKKKINLNKKIIIKTKLF